MWRQLLASFAACLVVVGCGTSFGWVAPTLVKRIDEDSEVQMTSSESSWMVAMIEVVNLLAPIPVGMLSDRIGRKLLIQITGPCYILSLVAILYYKTFTSLFFARVLQSLGVVIAFTIVPLYLGEIASQRIRGALTSFFQVAFYFGLLYEYTIRPLVSYELFALLTIFFPLAFLALFSWQRESPHHYLMKGEDEKAERSLMSLRGATGRKDVETELSEMKTTIKGEMGSKASWRDIVATPSNRRALLISQVVLGVRLLSGGPVFIFYSTEIFRKTGFTQIPEHKLTIIMVTVLIVSAIFSTLLTDFAGRKPLIIISSVGCTISLFVISAYFYCLENLAMDLSENSWVGPSFIILFNIFLAFGLDPVSNTYRAELFPANTRAFASSITTLNFMVGTFLTIKIYQVVTEAFGAYLIFLMYALFTLFGTVWMFFILVETKNKSLAEVQNELAKR